MLPYIIGAGIGALLLKALFDGEDEEQGDKKLFVSFAVEDSKYRDFLVAQAKNEKTPFSFIDMSVKQPWNESEWKRKCRKKIKSCDGMIVLLSKKTWHSGGSRWEIKCANEEGVPVIGMHIKKNDKGAIPPELEGSRIIEWSWDNLSQSIKKF
jgi:hypothetical protein